MSRSGQLRVSRTKSIPVPNDYIRALYAEFGQWAFDEERAPEFKGKWRESVFSVPDSMPLDLEIGTGNGLHFSHRAIGRPDRLLIGLELKYKPLIQSIRRVVRAGGRNARVARYNASLLTELFSPGEINDVFLFFPDPWSKRSQHKHRLVQDEFMKALRAVQRPGAEVHFKTDSPEYFAFATERFRRSDYEILGLTEDLHRSEFATGNFVTQFERLFIRQGLAIGYVRLRNPG